MSIQKKSIIFLVLANIIWGAAFPIYKWTLDIIGPFTFAFLRFFLAAIIILPFTYKNIRIPKKDIPLLILVSIISITLQISFLFLGLKLTPSINAPIILSSGPIVLIIASAFIFKDVVKTKVLIGTLVSLVGVLIVIFKPVNIDLNSTSVALGNLLIVLAMLCSVAQYVVLKKLMEHNDPMTIVFWSFLIGAIPFLIPMFLFEPNFLSYDYMNPQALIGIIYATILSSIVCSYFIHFGIKYIKASEIGIFSYVDPIATILIAVPLLSEKITNLYLAGTFLVFFGIFIAEERIHYHPLGRLFKKE